MDHGATQSRQPENVHSDQGLVSAPGANTSLPHAPELAMKDHTMEPAANRTTGIAPFIQALIAVMCLAITFAAGLYVGRTTAPSDSTIRVVIPDSLELRGLPNQKTECLDWVSEHFKDPSAGTFSLVCNGRLP